MASKVAVVGTGRCGTTFLIQLLTRLGYDTGLTEQDGIWYSRVWQNVLDMSPDGEVLRVDRVHPIGLPGPYHVYDSKIRAGCETHICMADTAADVAALPQVIKNPRLATTAGKLIDAGILQLAHAILPVRDLGDVAMSKKGLYRQRDQPFYAAEKQRLEEISAMQLGRFVADMVTRNVPLTILHFPRILRDPVYLYDTLITSKALYGVDLVPDYKEFYAAYQLTVHPEYLTISHGKVL